MSTTALFAELLIVGLQAVVWMTLLVGLLFGPQWFGQIAVAFREAGALVTVGIMAVGYVAGVILDEFYESLIDPWAQRLRDRCREEGSPEMWDVQAYVFAKSSSATAQLQYIRSRIRIVRSSVFNFSLIVVFSLAYLTIRVQPSIRWRTGAIFFIALAGLIAVPITVFVYRRLVLFYWGRAKSIYKSLLDST